MFSQSLCRPGITCMESIDSDSSSASQIASRSASLDTCLLLLGFLGFRDLTFPSSSKSPFGSSLMIPISLALSLSISALVRLLYTFPTFLPLPSVTHPAFRFLSFSGLLLALFLFSSFLTTCSLRLNSSSTGWGALSLGSRQLLQKVTGYLRMCLQLGLLNIISSCSFRKLPPSRSQMAMKRLVVSRMLQRVQKQVLRQNWHSVWRGTSKPPTSCSQPVRSQALTLSLRMQLTQMNRLQVLEQVTEQGCRQPLKEYSPSAPPGITNTSGSALQLLSRKSCWQAQGRMVGSGTTLIEGQQQPWERLLILTALQLWHMTRCLALKSRPAMSMSSLAFLQRATCRLYLPRPMNFCMSDLKLMKAGQLCSSHTMHSSPSKGWISMIDSTSSVLSMRAISSRRQRISTSRSRTISRLRNRLIAISSVVSSLLTFARCSYRFTLLASLRFSSSSDIYRQGWVFSSPDSGCILESIFSHIAFTDSRMFPNLLMSFCIIFAPESSGPFSLSIFCARTSLLSTIRPMSLSLPTRWLKLSCSNWSALVPLFLTFWAPRHIRWTPSDRFIGQTGSFDRISLDVRISRSPSDREFLMLSWSRGTPRKGFISRMPSSPMLRNTLKKLFQNFWQSMMYSMVGLSQCTFL